MMLYLTKPSISYMPVMLNSLGNFSLFISYLFLTLFYMFFLQAGGKSIVLDANATSQLRNQGLDSTNDSPKFQHKVRWLVRLFSCGLAIRFSSFQYSVPVWDFVEFHSTLAQKFTKQSPSSNHLQVVNLRGYQLLIVSALFILHIVVTG